jgi:hypothetical protein
VIIRYDGREAHLHDEGSVCTITFVTSSPGATMASLSDQRRDLFTTRNLAKSILMHAHDLMSRSHRNPLLYTDSLFKRNSGSVLSFRLITTGFAPNGVRVATIVRSGVMHD